jgi:hypothetical protein
VAAQLWWRLRQRSDAGEVPPEVEKRLWGIYAANRVRNDAIRAEEERVVKAFAAAGVAVWMLKGTRLGERLYGDAGARQVSDIDLLIAPQELERANEVLRACGYVLEGSAPLEELRESAEIVYVRGAAGDGIAPLDLHQRVAPYQKTDALADHIRAHRGEASDEVLLVYLCVNQVAHRFARLQQFLDIARLLEMRGAALDWNGVLRLAQESRLGPGVFYSLTLAREMASDGVPHKVLEALRPKGFERRWMRRILGGEVAEIVARGPALDGPYGALVSVLCAQPGRARARTVGSLLFPAPAQVRQETLAGPEHSVVGLYLGRLARKLPEAARAVVRR